MYYAVSVCVAKANRAEFPKLDFSLFFVSGDGIYWSDGFGGTIGMATIDGEVVYRGNRNYIDRIPGVQGLVAVNTTAHIGQ